MPHGFGLLETIFSMFILFFVLLSVSAMFPSSTLAMNRARAELLAQNVADDALERWRLYGWNRPHPEAGGKPGVLLQTADDVYTVERERISYTVRVKFSAVSAAPPIKRVLVTVNWNWQGKDYAVARELHLGRVLTQ